MASQMMTWALSANRISASGRLRQHDEYSANVGLYSSGYKLVSGACGFVGENAAVGSAGGYGDPGERR